MSSSGERFRDFLESIFKSVCGDSSAEHHINTIRIAKVESEWRKMSDKVKKQASSLPFSLSKIFSRISTMKPTLLVTSTVVIGVSLFLLAGGVYWINNATNPDLTFRYPISYYDGKYFHFILDRSIGGGLSDQFGVETVLVYVVYAMGFGGLLALYQSARNAYNQRSAYMTLMIGSMLILLAYIFVEYFILLKGG